MSPDDDSKNAGNLDEISQPFTRYGWESVELKRLEETARLMERLEWSLARRSSRPRKDSGGSD